jgi:hypothetical protein
MPTTDTDRLHDIHFTAPGSHISIASAVWAGLVAGMVFMALEMIMVSMFMGMSAWAPPRMIAAIAMGRDVLPPPDSFNMAIVGTAIVVHLALSLIYAFIFAFVAKGRSINSATMLGAGFGLLLYAVNFYGFTAVFPWFADARNWISVFAHLVYGAVLGATYAACANRKLRPPAR